MIEAVGVSNPIQQLASELRPRKIAVPGRRLATISAIDWPNSKMDLTVGTTTVVGVAFARTWFPTVGDIVRVSTFGGDWFVEGPTQAYAAPGPFTATVAADEGTTTLAPNWADLTTAGPAVTVNMLNGQQVLVHISANHNISAAGTNGAVFTFEVAGPGSSDLAADQANGCETGVVNEWVVGARTTLFTATADGSHVFTMKYQAIGNSTASFKRRRIVVQLVL